MTTLDDKLRIRLEKSLRDRLKRVAAIMKRKEGAVARLAIEEYVDRHDKPNHIRKAAPIPLLHQTKPFNRK